ncbi:MAG: tRNA (adenine-N1)-methyltransferase [Candidatus Altiarchaeota archaeon]|nr:tRNA (adenine-N1)-methyltransferase [Candidatus Altiarchaeota archaeon]
MKRLLIDDHGRKQLVKEGQDLHTHGGIIKEQDLRKIGYSGSLETHLGKRFYIAKPTVTDFIEKMQKRAQIVYPKDAALIIGLTGISSGSRVLEAGSGVGGLTIMLANAVRPDGVVYSYELREEHLEEAKAHIAECSLEDFVKFRNKDVYEGIEEKDLDLAVLDLPEPWLVSEAAAKNLRLGGFLVSYSPSIEQTKKFVTSLPKDFQDVSTVENLVREWEVTQQRCRPKTRMIAHTGFITFARKLQDG